MNDKELNKLISDAFEDEIKIPEGLSERLENRLNKEIQKHSSLVILNEVKDLKDSSSLRNDKRIAVFAIAASILLCVGLFFAINFHSQDSDKLADTFQDPIEARIYAEKTLIMVSENLNKGLDSFEKAKENMDYTHKVLNNSLTIK